MSDTIEVDVPDATTEVQEKTVEQRKADLIAERKARLLGDEDTETTEAEEVEVDVPETDDAEVETPESEAEEETTEDVLSQVDEIDIDSLTEDDILAIAKEKELIGAAGTRRRHNVVRSRNWRRSWMLKGSQAGSPSSVALTAR